MPDGRVLFGMPFLFTLLLFKTRGGGAGVARGSKGKAGANLLPELSREQNGIVCFGVASQYWSCVIGDP